MLMADYFSMIEERYTERYDFLFLLLAGLFIASLVACNLIFQKFFLWQPFGLYTFELSVGILPYPITFLCTDLISEIYGKKAATRVVLVGFLTAIFISLVVLIALTAPAASWSPVDDDLFKKVFGLNAPAIAASMFAYLTAQYCDVRLFHFWKKLTKGKHLWLRNNASTMLSQLVDTAAVLLLLCSAGAIEWSKFWILLENGYIFKVLIAALDTPVIYLAMWLLSKFVPDWENRSKT